MERYVRYKGTELLQVLANAVYLPIWVDTIDF